MLITFHHCDAVRAGQRPGSRSLRCRDTVFNCGRKAAGTLGQRRYHENQGTVCGFVAYSGCTAQPCYRPIGAIDRTPGWVARPGASRRAGRLVSVARSRGAERATRSPGHATSGRFRHVLRDAPCPLLPGRVGDNLGGPEVGQVLLPATPGGSPATREWQVSVPLTRNDDLPYGFLAPADSVTDPARPGASKTRRHRHNRQSSPGSPGRCQAAVEGVGRRMLLTLPVRPRSSGEQVLLMPHHRWGDVGHRARPWRGTSCIEPGSTGSSGER